MKGSLLWAKQHREGSSKGCLLRSYCSDWQDRGRKRRMERM